MLLLTEKLKTIGLDIEKPIKENVPPNWNQNRILLFIWTKYELSKASVI